MAYVCFNCLKRNRVSRRSQHHKGVAGGAWKHKAQKSRKVFRANLHSVRVFRDATIERVKLCTDCISLLHKKGSLPGNILAFSTQIDRRLNKTI